MRKILRGIAGSPGVGVGRVELYRSEKIESIDHKVEDSAAELERYRFAVERFCRRLREKAEQVERSMGSSQADILRSQVEMANDPYLKGQVEGRIAAFQSAEAALDAVCAGWLQNFLSSESEVTRQRAVDIRDLRDGILRILLGLPENEPAALGPNAILVANEIAPSAMTAIDAGAVAGIILAKGGRASHSAILARAMGIPTVVGAAQAALSARNGEWAVVDGGEGQAYLSPNEEELAFWREKREAQRKDREILKAFTGKKAITADGQKITAFATVGAEGEALSALHVGCDGVGLLRTEFLFLNRPGLPDEDEQYRTYRRFAEMMDGKPLIIRTLDIGGDKRLPGLSWEREENPMLSTRGLRLYRRETEIYTSQLRAILRAGAYGDVRLLTPMVTGLGELRWVKARVEEAKRGLKKEGRRFREDIPLGVMTETPAAAVLADLISKEADFLSIGLNDLTQYILAVDRDEPKVSYLYSYYDPAVLRMLKRIISCAADNGTPVCMCGEAAADPLFLPILLGLGLKSFSLQPGFLLSFRRCLSLWNLDEARRLTDKVMSLNTEERVHRLLENERRP